MQGPSQPSPIPSRQLQAQLRGIGRPPMPQFSVPFPPAPQPWNGQFPQPAQPWNGQFPPPAQAPQLDLQLPQPAANPFAGTPLEQAYQAPPSEEQGPNFYDATGALTGSLLDPNRGQPPSPLPVPTMTPAPTTDRWDVVRGLPAFQNLDPSVQNTLRSVLGI